MKIAFLGCGGIAARHVRAARALTEADLVACCGRTQDRAQGFAEVHKIPKAYDNLDRMLDEARPELVIVSLPPYVRSGEIERIANRGVHLLVEKPIALDNDTAEKLVSSTRKPGLVAAVGFMYRFGEAIRRWQEQETGRIGMYTGVYHCNDLHAPWWRDESRSGGQIVEQVIHQVDIIRYLMGEPDSVYARRANLFHRNVEGYTGEDVSAIVFAWDDGRIATLNASNIAEPGTWHKEWAIYAEHVTGRFSGFNEAVFTRVADRVTETVSSTMDPFVAQLQDVIASIKDKRGPSVPMEEGARSLRLALLARKSADEKRELRR